MTRPLPCLHCEALCMILVGFQFQSYFLPAKRISSAHSFNISLEHRTLFIMRGWMSYSLRTWCCEIADGLHDMASYVKEIIKSLRELKKSSSLAYEMLKLFSDGQESSAVSLISHCIVPLFRWANRQISVSMLMKWSFLGTGNVESQGTGSSRLQHSWRSAVHSLLQKSNNHRAFRWNYKGESLTCNVFLLESYSSRYLKQ